MSDKYSKEDCDKVHGKLEDKIDHLIEHASYTRGQVDMLVDSQKELRQNNSDWWSRIGCFIACAIAYFKGV